MSLYGLSDTQLNQLMYPNGRGSFYYGNQPIQVNQSSGWMNGVQPGGVSQVSVPSATGAGSQVVPVKTATAVDTGDGVNANLGVSPGQAASTGLPAGASTAATSATGATPYASIASQAIGQIAQVAATYAQNSAKATALKDTSVIPQIPESAGAATHFQAPALAGL